MIKTLDKKGIEGAHLHITRATCDKFTADVVLSRDGFKAFPLRSGTRQGCTVLPRRGAPAEGVRQDKETKNHTEQKGRSRIVFVCP